MFTVRILTDDESPRQLVAQADIPITSAVSSRPISKEQQDFLNEITELKGGVHFYRRLTTSPAGVSTSETTKNNTDTAFLFFPVVPLYVSPMDFISFIDPKFIKSILHVCLIRNDAINNRYCIIIEVGDKDVAEAFVISHHGKRFDGHQEDFCYVYSVISVELWESAALAAKPPTGFIELPTCPVCLGRFNVDISGIEDSLCNNSLINFSCKVCRLCERRDEKPDCKVCGSSETSWICMLCGFVGCSRYEVEHPFDRLDHWKATSHSFYMDYKSRDILDYGAYTFVQRRSKSDDVTCMSLDGDFVGGDSKDDLGMQLANLQSCSEELKVNCSKFSEVLKNFNDMAIAGQKELENIQKKQEEYERKLYKQIQDMTYR